MLYLIGIGLSEGDISLKGLEAVKKADKVYLEAYTSVIPAKAIKDIERRTGKKIIPLNRKQVEEERSFLKGNNALLVIGDPLSATTHLEFLKDAKVEVIHAPSVLTAVGRTGLSLYKFGKTASIPLPEPSFKPESFFDILEENQSIDAHTLFLLDLKPEKKYLTIPEALKILLDIAKKRKSKLLTDRTLVIGCARLGNKDELIKAGPVEELLKRDFGRPPYTLIVPGKLNFVEEDFLKSRN